MTTMKLRTAFGLAAVVVSSAVGATPALAAPASAAAGGTAPACIQRSYVNNADGGMQAWPYNNCGKTMRIRIIVHHWRDTSCKSIPNNHSAYFSTVGGQYDRTAVC